MDSIAGADVSFQEEQESQIDFTLYQNTDEQDFPASVDCESPEHAYRKPNATSNIDEPGSDDTVLDDTSALIASPVSQHEFIRSQVEETQFVPVERDTQPSIDYDVSPTTRRILENTDSKSARLSPTGIALPLLERDEIITHHIGPEFRFGKAPNPSKMVLTRPPPGQSRSHQKELTDRELLMSRESSPPIANHVMPFPVMEPNKQLAIVSATPATKIGILPSCSGTSKDAINFEEGTDPILSNTQIEPTHPIYPDEAQTDDAAENGSPFSHSKPKSLKPGLSVGTEYGPANNSRRPLVHSKALVKSTTSTEILEIIKPHNINKEGFQAPRHPSCQTKSGSPPFMEAVLSNSRRKKIESPITATISAVHTGVSDITSDPATEDITNLKLSHSAFLPATKSVRSHNIKESLVSIKCPDKRGGGASNPPNFTVDEMLNRGDTELSRVSDIGLPQSKDFRRDFLRNQRPRSRNNNSIGFSSRHRTNRSTSTGSINRPLPEPRTQPLDVRENQDLHNTRDSRVQKRGSPGTNGTHHMQSNHKVPIAGNAGLTGEGLLQMAAVMFTAEKGQLDAASAKNKIQQVQIEDLRHENYVLKADIARVSQENQELLKEKAEFRTRCDRYKSNMNVITVTQQELESDARDLNQKTLKFLKENQREMEARLLEAKSQNFKDSKAMLQEARLEIHRQNETIGILKRDIDNRLLDLQRERGLRETLQKQLENREKQQDELKAVLFEHQRDAISVLSSNKDMLKDVLDTCVDSANRWTECQELIKSLKESELKPIPALTELRELMVALSTNVKKRFQAAEDDSVQMRDAVTERLSELKNCLESMNDDQFVEREINATNANLREENAKLRENVKSHEIAVERIESQLIESQKELQHCRIQLAETQADLSKANATSFDDGLLQTQLQDLQTSFSLEKKKSAASESKAEKLRADLREQEGLTLLAQQEANHLQHQLRQTNAKVSAFDAQKESYIREMSVEANMLRIQMERDCRARLAEDLTRQNGIISGLRRQITEADDKIMRTQQSLQDAEKARSNEEAECQRLHNQVSTIMTELNNLQERARLAEQTRNRTDSELSVAQKQLVQFMEVGADWNFRVQENTLEFVKRFKEMEDRFQISQRVVEVEVDRLEAVGLALQKKDEDSAMLINNMARHLKSKGVLVSGLTIFDSADGLPGGQSHQMETDANLSYSPATGDLYDLPASSQGSNSSGSRNSIGSGNLASSNKQTSSSARSIGEHARHAANSLHVLFDEDRTIIMRETESSLQPSYSKISSKRTGRENYSHQSHLNTAALEVSSTSTTIINEPQPFSATSTTPHLDIRATKCIQVSNVHFSDTNKLKIATGAVIPDSQEDLMRGQVPGTSPKLAERSQNMAGGSQAVSPTGVTGYSIQALKTYVGKLKALPNERGHVFFEDQANDSRSIGSGDESSGLSEPPDNVDKLDFAEFMDSEGFEDLALWNSLDDDNVDSKASLPVLSPKPNSSRARAGPLVPLDEAKQPKGILKRTNSVIRTSDPTTNAYPNGKPSRNSHFLESQSLQRGITANRRISRRMSGTMGSDGGTHRSPYNRPVAGSKDLHKSSHFQEQDAPNILTISSSPVMGQPQRNSKKRTLSGIGLIDSKRPTKILRSVRREQ